MIDVDIWFDIMGLRGDPVYSLEKTIKLPAIPNDKNIIEILDGFSDFEIRVDGGRVRFKEGENVYIWLETCCEFTGNTDHVTDNDAVHYADLLIQNGWEVRYCELSNAQVISERKKKPDWA
jgi:hypothetical protein